MPGTLQEETSHVANRISEAAARQAGEYRADASDERPLGGYLKLLAVYTAAVGAASGAVAWRRVPLPESISWSDLVRMSVATHKLSRLLTKDSVTGALRSPFTRFEGPEGEGEVHEEVRGSGMRKAAGELVTCPFCMGQWVATGFVFGMIMAPRVTRLAATVFTALSASDFLQLGYATAVKRAEA